MDIKRPSFTIQSSVKRIGKTEKLMEDSADLYVKIPKIKQPKNERLLKYKEPIATETDSLLFSGKVNISNATTEKCYHLKTFPLSIQNKENECLSRRNHNILQLNDECGALRMNNTGPPSMVCSLEINPSNITHPDLILGMYFHIVGLYCFNMDHLKMFYDGIFKLAFHGVGMFVFCSYDIFHSVDLRVQFYESKEYTLSLYGDKSELVSEDDVWEGVFVSEFIRLMAAPLSERWTLPMQVVMKDLVFLDTEVKIKYELIQTLIKYLTKCLITGFDTTCGFKEVDYLNNNMIKAIINFFKLETEESHFLNYFLDEISVLLDDHEVYLITYLNLIVEFEIQDSNFMELINQVFNIIHDPFLVKQYLRLQLKFFERDMDKYFDICFDISKKLLEMDPVQPFLYLNFIKYSHKAGKQQLLSTLINSNKQLHLSVDLIDAYYFFYKKFWNDNFVEKTLTNESTLKGYELEFLRRKCGKVIRNIENIGILSKGKCFFPCPCKEHEGYLETIWNNKKIFQEMKTNYFFNSENGVLHYSENKTENDNVKILYRKLLVLMDNVTLREIRKSMLEDESYTKLLISNQKKFPIGIVQEFLSCYKQALNIISNMGQVNQLELIQVSIFAYLYYFTGFYQKSYEILIFQLNNDFNINNYSLLKKVFLECNMKKMKLSKNQVDTLVKLTILAISYESRCFNELQYSTVIFIKKVLLTLLLQEMSAINESNLGYKTPTLAEKTDLLVKKFLEVMTPFINKSLMNKVVSFLKQIR